MVLIIIIIAVSKLQNKDNTANLKQVYVATGGGKENFIADEEVVSIMQKKYGLNIIYDSWSNGKMVKNALVREDGSKYDAMFCSDQRFYDYFKTTADSSKGEAPRDRVLDGGLTLNTPIVIYSWDIVVDALINENIVTEKLQFFLEENKWLNL